MNTGAEPDRTDAESYAPIVAERMGEDFCNWSALTDAAVDYEPRRVAIRYSWSGSRTVELVGPGREAAIDFARRVVPELAE